MVLRMMQRLEKNVEGIAQQGVGYRFTHGPCLRANDLFPFPTTFCEIMDLLGLAAALVDQDVLEIFEPAQNWLEDEAIFDLTLMNFFGHDVIGTNLAQ